MAFEQFKQRQASVWGAGPFEKAAETIADVHDAVVTAVPPRPGERWLDVACGTGAVVVRAAQGGAAVTGVDLAPALIDTARRLVAERGLDVDLRVCDCEELPFADATFDTVTSTFGMMFAPDHAAAARELARVVKPGGRMALATWHPERGVPDVFRLLSEYQPAPPPGAGNPFDWGRPDHLHGLLGATFELAIEERVSTQTASSPDEIWQLMSSSFGPVKVLVDGLAPDSREALRRIWSAFYEGYRTADGGVAHPRPYLLVTGTRRD